MPVAPVNSTSPDEVAELAFARPARPVLKEGPAAPPVAVGASVLRHLALSLVAPTPGALLVGAVVGLLPWPAPPRPAR